jgi:hypothetical protein
MLRNISSGNLTPTYISLRGRESLNPLKYRGWLRQFSGCPLSFPTSTVGENTASHAKPSIDFCTGFNPYYHPTSPPFTRHRNAEQLTNIQSENSFTYYAVFSLHPTTQSLLHFRKSLYNNFVLNP